jgi:redox-sensitive bicupin YhaK (pirin superfamily)
MSSRRIKQRFHSKPVLEGAGVHLKRAFGFHELGQFDPFLLLDDFRSDTPAHYRKGFPWHPHRGIETITYILRGRVEHGDSLGNAGEIDSGDVQWMTAGSGIIHQEMPKGDGDGHMDGFQLWANLPASQKMMPPRYRDITAAQIPEVVLDNGVRIKVICGRVGEVAGPVHDIVIDPEYLDVTLPADANFDHQTPVGHTVLAYIIDGLGTFGPDNNDSGPQGDGTLLLFGNGSQIEVRTADKPLRFLLISGKPLKEPIAWGGPIVMNTQDELQLAFDEFQNGTFIKHTPPES